MRSSSATIRRRAEPRRIITALDGTVEVKLRPGNYTVESDKPLAFRGRRYQWMQMVDIAAGRDTVLDLTAANAEVTDLGPSDAAPGAAPESDTGFLLQQWRNSVVGIWTPTTHASGFLVDARGLVVTNQRGIGAATSAEVQLTRERKVAARVLAADAERDVAILWLDPTAVAGVRPVPLVCTPAGKPPEEGADIFTIGEPLRGEKDMTSGVVRGVKPKEIVTDFVLPSGSAGGPVFSAGGAVVGLTSFVIDPEDASQRRLDWMVVRVDDVCAALAQAEQAMKTGQPPGGTLLPVEPMRPFPVAALEATLERRFGSLDPYTMSSADFDIALLTPFVVYHELNASTAIPRTTSKETRSPNAELSFMRRRMDFGAWSEVRIGGLASAADPRHAQVRRGILDEAGARRGADTGRGPAAHQTLQVGIRPTARAVRRRRGDADPPLRTGKPGLGARHDRGRALRVRPGRPRAALRNRDARALFGGGSGTGRQAGRRSEDPRADLAGLRAVPDGGGRRSLTQS